MINRENDDNEMINEENGDIDGLEPPFFGREWSGERYANMYRRVCQSGYSPEEIDAAGLEFFVDYLGLDDD